MGFQTLDLVPIAPHGPTPITPPGRDQRVKVAQVSRTDTVATPKIKLQGAASPFSIRLFGSSASNAGTTATVTFTVSNNSGTLSTGTYDVKTNGAVTGIINMTNMPIIQPIPMSGDITISAQYAETGAASSAGGPWNFVVEYVD